MKGLIHEVHRRSLWQVLGIYVGASWLVLQAVDTMAGALSLPAWSASFAFFLLVVGLPIVLATAFVQGGVTRAGRSDTQPGPSGDEAPAPIETAGDTASGKTTSRSRHRLFTWRNAILGGAGAFALLGLLTAGWLGSRALGVGPAATLQARGVLDDQSLVVLADFTAADAELAAAATQALRVDLSQSQAIRLADQALVSEALQRMEREPGEPLTADVAREVARREGAGAVIHGAISRAGEGYVFTAELVDAADGTTLTSQRQTAGGPGDVIGAIEELSKKLRERIGESLGSIRAGEPLARVTTSNLQALELYSRAQRDGGGDRLALYEQAVELDPGFAMAWNGIAILFRNSLSERARMLEARTRAYELRDRLTRRERHLTSAIYFLDVLGEPERALREYDAMLELDPADETAITNLGVVYHDLRRNDLSEQLSLRKVELAPESYGTGWWNLIQAQIHLGKFEEAWRSVDSVAARFPGARGEYVGSLVASNEGDFERAAELLLGMLETVPPGFSDRLHGDLGAILGTQGRLAEAERRFETAASITLSSSPVDYWEDAIQTAWMELAVWGRPGAALQVMDDAESEVPLESLAVLDRPYGPLIEVQARAGALARARELLSELEREIPPEYELVTRSEHARAEGEIALAEGRFDEAVAAFRRSDSGYCTICALTGLGAAYDRAGQADSAIAVYIRYVDTPFPDRYASYAYPLGPALGPALERIGQLYDEQGDLRNAATFYARFVHLWSAADDELQPRVRVAQARMEEILREIG